VTDTLIRKAEPADLRAVQTLVNASWRKTYAMDFAPEQLEEIIADRHALAVLTDQLGETDAAFLVAEREGAIIGHAFARPKAENLYLERLHVEPSLKGGGIGRKLMGAVFDHAGPDRPVTLEVLEDNRVAIGFYETLGFTVADAPPDPGDDLGVAALVMARPPR